METPLIAVVNDDPIFLALMEDLLEGEGYRTRSGPGGQGIHALLARARICWCWTCAWR
jgi:CheY-like chemotaxis protein